MPRRPSLTLSGRRWWKTWIVLAAAVLLLAVAVRALPVIRARTGHLPTGRAQWIWKAMDRKDNYPTVFYAIRDFELESPPARARLLIAADEEYVATLNGRRIAAGVYFRRNSGTILDAYEVGPLLRAGGNRLVVELRSGRGTGGLLAALEDEAGEPFLVSDESWRIFPRHELGLVRGWLPLGDDGGGGEPAFCWGNPPLGRWGRPRLGPAAPPLLPRAPLVPAVSVRPLPLNLLLYGGAGEVGRLPGSPVLYDWGREVEGYLTLDVPPSKDPGTGLLFTGAEPPDPRRSSLTAPVLVLPGRHDWMDAQPRRFRYAVVVGLARPARASVLPAPARSASRDPEEMKVFGIDGPRLRTPVEDEVWSKLQRFAGIARREEL